MVTKINNWETIPIGLAELYLAPYAAYESDINVALTNTEYYSSLAEISMTASKSFIQRKGANGNVIVLIDNFLVASDLKITAKFIEVSDVNLDIALGGDGTSPNFLQRIFETPEILRAEMKFRFPNKINYFYVVLPTVQVVTPTVDMVFNPEDMMKVPLEMAALSCSHANWASYPYGRPIFV